MSQEWAKPCRTHRAISGSEKRAALFPSPSPIYKVQAFQAGVSSSLRCPDKTHHHTPQSSLGTAMLLDGVAGEPVLPLLQRPCPTGQLSACPGSKRSLTPPHSTNLVFENTKLVSSSWAKYFQGAKPVMLR